MIQPVRQAFSAIDPALPLLEVDTLSEEENPSMAGERLAASLATIFGILAAFLAAVGLYGLLAYLVILREREVGIRMALGARRLDIGLLIGKQALTMIVGGLVLGLGAAALVAPWTSSIFYGVAPWSSRSFVGATSTGPRRGLVWHRNSVLRAIHIEVARCPLPSVNRTNCRTPFVIKTGLCRRIPRNKRTS